MTTTKAEMFRLRKKKIAAKATDLKHYHGFFSHAQKHGSEIGLALEAKLRVRGVNLWIDKHGLT